MQTLQEKTVSQSITQQVQIVFPEHANGYGRLFGGQLMQWIDIVAAVVARRHAGRNVTTAAVDNLIFKAAAFVNDTVTLCGRITFVGRTSMEVKVDTFVESLSGESRLINTAYLTVIALDENEKPVPVPGLRLETDQERADWQEGYERRRNRLAKKERPI